MVRRILALALSLFLVVPVPTWGADSTLAFERGSVGIADTVGTKMEVPSFTGAAEHAIPILVPPGTGGMQPNLVLRYSSASTKDSWVGYGWTLSLGAIERSLKEGVPTYTETDTFLLGGQELVNDPGNPDPDRFHTRRESFQRIRRLPIADAWEVTDKSGTVSTYGGTDQARLGPDPSGGQTYRWLLETVEDLHGNRIEIDYDRSVVGEAHPQTIRYTVHPSCAACGTREVRFELEDRPDALVSHAAASTSNLFPQRLTKRLKAIDVFVGGARIRRYELRYVQSPASQRSLLEAVELYGSDGDPNNSSRTAPLQWTFSYRPTTPGWALVQDGRWDMPSGVFFMDSLGRDGGTRLADMNGDGLPDLIREVKLVSTDVGNDGLSGVYLNARDGAGLPTEVFAPRTDSWRLPMATSPNDSTPRRMAFLELDGGITRSTGVVLTNLNRDGRPDVLRLDFGFDPNAPGCVLQGRYLRSDSSGSGFVGIPASGLGPTHLTADIGSGVGGVSALADLDGDGRPELLSRGMWFDGNDQPVFGTVFRRILVDDVGFMAPDFPAAYSICTTADDACRRSAWLGEIQLKNAGASCEDRFDRIRRFGKRHIDVNDDGLDDHVTAYFDEETATRTENTLLNWGHGFLPDGDPTWLVPPEVTFDFEPDTIFPGAATLDEGVRIADVNGDGREDLLVAKAGAPRRLWLGTANPAHPWCDPLFDNECAALGAWALPADVVDTNGKDTGVRLADLNGDGMVDVIRAVGGSGTQVWLNAGVVPDLLEVATNPTGGERRFTYTPSTQFDNTDASGLPGLAQMVPVVTREEVVDPASGDPAIVAQIDYAGGLFDSQEQEFRGFRRVTRTVFDQTVEVTSHQDVARAGLPERVRILDAGAAGWEEREFQYTPDADGQAPYVSLLSRREVIQKDGDPTNERRVRTDFEYDADTSLVAGNLTARIEYGDLEDPTDDRVWRWRYVPNPSLWLLDRVWSEHVWPGTSTVVDDANAAAALSIRRFAYDGLGVTATPTVGDLTRIEQVTKDANGQDVDVLATTLGYGNPFGNVTSITPPGGVCSDTGTTCSSGADCASGTCDSVTTTVEYDATYQTFVTAVQAPLAGHREEFDYTATECGTEALPVGAGLVHKAQGPNDLVASTFSLRCYDVFGRPVREQAPGNLAERTVSYAVDPGLLVTEQVRTSPAGASATWRASTSRSDGPGRLVERTQEGPQGQDIVERFAYDARGRVKTHGLPGLGAAVDDVEFGYDVLGRVASIRLPTDETHTIQYARGVVGPDGEKGLVTWTDPEGHVRQARVDPFGRLWAMREGLSGPVTTYRHDILGRLRQVIDARANVTTIGFDQLGRRTFLADPDTGMWNFTYDAAGNLRTQEGPLDPNNGGQPQDVVEWRYDALNRATLRSVNGADGASWTYDTATNGIGAVGKTFVPAQSHEVLKYDLLGRPTDEVVTAGGASHSFLTDYDGLGAPLGRQYPDARSVVWDRDARGYLTAIRAGSGEDYATGIQWDGQGRLTHWVAGNGVATTQNYVDGLLQDLTIVGSQTLRDQIYTYNRDGQLESVSGSFPAGPFQYDDRHRLTAAPGPWGLNQAQTTLRYAHDDIGNLTCRGAENLADCAGTGGTELVYPGPGAVKPHAATQIDGLPVTYDLAGNLTAWSTRDYDYDALGQLVTASENGVLQAAFVYDGQGRRIQTVDATGAVSVTTHFVAGDFEWDATNNQARIHVALAGRRVATLVGPYDPPSGGTCGGAPGGTILEFLWIGGGTWLAFVLLGGLAAGRRRRVPRWRPALATGVAGAFLVVVVVPYPLVQPAWAVAPAGALFYHGDHLGSTVVVTDDGGQMLANGTYQPFGGFVPLPLDAQDDPPSSTTPTFGFTGQRFEDGIGIYDYGARWYDPTMGRFLQPDPIVASPFDPQNLNRYSYVLNDPLNLVDPTGLQQRTPGGIVVGVRFDDGLIFPELRSVDSPTVDVGGGIFGAGGGGQVPAGGAGNAGGVVNVESSPCQGCVSGSTIVAGEPPSQGAAAGSTLVQIDYYPLQASAAAGALGATHATSTVLNPDPNGPDFFVEGGADGVPGGSASASAAIGAGSGSGSLGNVSAIGQFGRTPENLGRTAAASQTVRIPLSFGKAVHGAQQYVNAVNAAGVPYNPFGPNSNTVAHSLIPFLGGVRPSPAAWAPGSREPFPFP